MDQSSESVEFPPRAPVVEANASDVLQSGKNSHSLFQPSHPIRQPENEVNEFQVLVRATVLSTVRLKLVSLRDRAGDYSDGLLAVAMLCFGGVLGALISKTSLTEPYVGKFVYIILPVLGTASIVSYFFKRGDDTANVRASAKELLELIPDPDKTEGAKVHEPE